MGLKKSLVSALLCLAIINAGAIDQLEGQILPGDPLKQKEFFKPELSISSTNELLEEVLPSLPNRQAWESFLASLEAGDRAPVHAFIDPRSGAATNLAGAFPLIPGRGVGNQVRLEDLAARIGRPVRTLDATTVADAVLAFVRAHQAALGVDTRQLGAGRAAQVSPDLWQVSIPQTYRGVPVRHGRLAATLNNGNLVLVGTETWGNVRGLSIVAKIDAEEALKAGFEHVGGRTAEDELLGRPALEILPVAPPEHQQSEGFGGPVGAGYRHRLVWTFVFRRPPGYGRWEVIVDAHDGEVLALQDVNRYAKSAITGGVYPLTSTGVCPTPQTCGTLQSGWPMPFADTGLAAPNDFTNSAGIYNYLGGTATTTLAGKYVKIVDACGAISNSSTTGSIDLGGAGGDHDCVTGGGSAGNTASSRAAFYEINKIAEMARGWLPGNTWLQGQLQTNVNVNDFCNALWNGTSINFSLAGDGCRNTGEIAAVLDHEWGHGLDDNDAAGALSSSSEAYADIAAIYTCRPPASATASSGPTTRAAARPPTAQASTPTRPRWARPTAISSARACATPTGTSTPTMLPTPRSASSATPAGRAPAPATGRSTAPRRRRARRPGTWSRAISGRRPSTSTARPRSSSATSSSTKAAATSAHGTPARAASPPRVAERPTPTCSGWPPTTTTATSPMARRT
jgi:trimeric autotransporter adhesin